MTERLRDQIAHLKAITPQLHAVTDDAERLVQLIEKFLGEECKLGLTAHVSFDQHEWPDGTESCSRLAYGRIDAQYRLMIYTADIDQSGEENHSNRTAWVNCTREVKLDTIQHIRGLLDAIAQRISSTIKRTQESTVMLRELLQGLGIAETEGK